MPRIPTLLIHLSAFLRPSRLKPDLKVPSIAHIDFRGLRKRGFNAVVIDKDNCITWPEHDHIWPAYEPAWNVLLSTFPAGRVLIVSNSAGTRKDPGSIAAESVSLSLRTPVLLHTTPKPGCAPEILSYFHGKLGQPSTLRGRFHHEALQIKKAEKEDENEILGRWLDEAENRPLLGPAVDQDGNKVVEKEEKDDRPLEGKMVSHQMEASVAARDRKDTKDKADEHHAQTRGKGQGEDGDPLRILVIGDRLFTDTLLAHRLSSLLPSPEQPREASLPPTPTVISIHTTSLPQPKDVKLLRWVEEKLSRSQIKPGPIDWGRYIVDPNASKSDITSVEDERPTLAGRWRGFKRDIRESKLEWNPRTWRPFPLAVGLGRSIVWTGKLTWRGATSGGRYIRDRVRPKAKEEAGVLAAVEGQQTGAGAGASS